MIQCSPFTCNVRGRQVYILVGSGSCKKYEPVTITGPVGDWTITYQSGRSHGIGWAWTLYVPVS